jgi:hypothetical protein
MTPVLCGLFKLLSSVSLGTEYNLIFDNTIVIPEQICIAWVNVMTSVLCGLPKLLSSDSLGTEYN